MRKFINSPKTQSLSFQLGTIILAIGIFEFFVAALGPIISIRADTKLEARWNENLQIIQEATNPTELITLGDSSVHNAIDSVQLSNELGARAIKLATFGDFTTYGDFKLLNLYLSRHSTPPKAIFLWHSLDVWGRELGVANWLFSAPDFKEIIAHYQLTHPSPLNSKETLRAPVNFLSDFLRVRLATFIPTYRYKYSLQLISKKVLGTTQTTHQNPHLKPQLDKQIEGFSGFRFSVSTESRYWFERLLELCKKNNIRIFIGKSPVHEKIISSSAAYGNLEKENLELDRFLTNYPNIVSLIKVSPVFTAQEGFDDLDHVNLEGRRRITHLYADLIKQNLQ